MSSQNQLKSHSKSKFPQRTCSKHQNRDCLFICSDRNRQDVVFKCDICVCKYSLIGQQLIPIQQIQESNEETIFWNWPFQDDPEIVKKLEAVAKKEKEEKIHTSTIQSFFEDLRKKVMDKINETQEKMEKKAANLNNYRDEIISQYNALCKKVELKQAVLNTSAEVEYVSAEIKEIVEQVLNNKQKIKQELERRIDEMIVQESSINYEIPNLLVEQIIESIDKIYMFLIDPQQIVQLPEEQATLAETTKSNTETLMELISNKFNFLSQSFQNQLKQQMEKYKKLFDSIELFPPQQKQQYQELNINILEKDETEEALQFITTLVHSKFEKEDEGDQVEIMKMNEDKKGIEVENIMMLLENQMNFICPSFSQKVKEMLGSIKKYLNCFKIDKIIQDGAQQITFKTLTFQEANQFQEISPYLKSFLSPTQCNQLKINELVEIASKMEEGTKLSPEQQRWDAQNILNLVSNPTNMCSKEQLSQLKNLLCGASNYIESHELTGHITQAQTWGGFNKEQLANLEVLGNKILLLQREYLKENKVIISPNIFSSENVSICKIIEKYSILDAFKPQLLENSNWKFMKTKYRDSQELILSPILSNGVCITQQKSIYANVVTHELLNNKSIYSLTCIFNKPPVSSSINVGLILDSEIDTKHVGESNSKSVYWSSKGYGGDEVIKGKPLCNIREEYTTLLFKFCIDTQQFYYADKLLNNINKVNSNFIDKNAKYRFGISFREPGDDRSVSLVEINEMKAENL